VEHRVDVAHRFGLLPVFSSNDAREGAVAFAEKRPPRWTGS
jgi:enoyl-CoA hydratase